MIQLTISEQARFDRALVRRNAPGLLLTSSQPSAAPSRARRGAQREARALEREPIIASSQSSSGLLSGFGRRLRTRSDSHHASAQEAQLIAIPSYFTPNLLWAQMRAGAPTVGLAIVNPASGPANAINQRYLEEVRQSQAAGLRVLGYVYTRYADGTRTLASVQDAIDRYFSWYAVDGIVFDEVSPDRSKQPFYATLHNYVKTKASSALTVINPGTQTHESYMAAADIVVTFEGTYAAYLSRYSAPGWIRRYASSRFWHLVHSTPGALNMQNAVKLSKERRAGWVYVTPDKMPNPWDTLPDSQYWDAELQAVAAR